MATSGEQNWGLRRWEIQRTITAYLGTVLPPFDVFHFGLRGMWFRSERSTSDNEPWDSQILASCQYRARICRWWLNSSSGWLEATPFANSFTQTSIYKVDWECALAYEISRNRLSSKMANSPFSFWDHFKALILAMHHNLVQQKEKAIPEANLITLRRQFGKTIRV